MSVLMRRRNANYSFILVWAPVIVVSSDTGGPRRRNYSSIKYRQHISKSCYDFIMGWGATINCLVTEFTQYTRWLVDRVVFKAIAIPTPFSGKRHFVKMK